LLQIDNRLPGVGTPFPVDLFDQVIDFIVEQLILSHVHAAGYADLHKNQVLGLVRVLFEKAVERSKTLHQSLGVVNSVDPDADPSPVEVQFLSPPVDFLVDGGTGRRGRMACKVDADGKRPNDRGFAASGDLEVLVIGFGLYRPVDRVEKILTMI